MKRNPKSGVTLLETMVGLLVMAMVAGLIASGFGTTARFFGRNEQASARVDQAIARRDLRIWLEHALPSAVPGDDRAVFAGSSGELVFLAVPPGGVFWPGSATEVVLNGPEASALATGLTPTQDSNRQVALDLSPTGTRLSLRYWGQVSPDEPARWHDSWPATAGLPDLVRIAFEGADMAPPPMIVRPAKAWTHSEMSLSSLVPPALPSRP
ncbi:MAG: prepilin-type N-terminal cleavage/methylation domain-containing protein [Tabrizicola sp.]|jgi:type II secretory pathway pseudopilin PulG|nr:prepilin-type N-terminal cleavage/methylation domain-containing protein [Tabrizicola sp.]